MMHLVRGDADKAFEECDFVDESEAHYDSLGCPAAMEPPVVVWKYNAAHNDFHAGPPPRSRMAIAWLP